ncbi:hypothetical protein [Mucilaginibacter flavidus]|uniref:hypothetical protein n=1 Tax=Mucilaginibacter flavidus TaxID=2949309 RepID=UPI0020924155|nr:hypothetical protein [Mucilaginibacter flavidus]MCO5948470.1 hypothetical protein [Mucilaginibacter flavidus]
MVKQFQTTRNRALIFNWVFIVGLTVLALNDQYLKWTFGNWITGKISDFAGLLIFPMFLQFLFPRISRVSVIITGALFVFWKLPISENFIHAYNKVALIPITRTIDYSDFVALLILPLAWYLIGRIDSYRIGRISPAFAACLIATPAAVVFMATSPPVSFYMQPGGDIHIGKSYRLKVSEDEALAKFKAIGFTVEPDTTQHESGRADYYLMKNVVLNAGKDTIETIQFGFLGKVKKPLLLINNVKLKKGSTLTDLEGLKKYYRKLIRSGIVNEVK